MEFTNKELKVIRSALTDSLIVLQMEQDDLNEPIDSLILALANYEEEVWALIEKISIRLGGI